MRWLSAALLACLLTTAGCSALVGPDQAEQTTVTPAPVPTAGASEADPPPGVTRDGLHSVSRLSVAHRAALENTSYTLREEYRAFGIDDDGSESARRAATIAVASPTRYRDEMVQMRTTANGTVVRFEQSTYADGTRWYERRDDGTVEYRHGRLEFTRDKFAARTAFYLGRYGVVDQSETTVVVRNGTRLYRIRGTGGEVPSTERLERYRIELLVGPDGLVRRFEVRYRTESDVVSYRFRYEDVGETTVPRPAWLENATNESGSPIGETPAGRPTGGA
ncbi:DUF7537 family lipoprotein [Haloarcula salina]|uniref:DUF7537 family lipoprotein n=1 Tax=Haloarcula salina TaxID=1429914 RepID=UPI003C6FD794